VSTQSAAAVYAAAATKVNAVLSAFSAAASSWPSSETGPQAAASAGPSITALKVFDTTLTNAQWPANANADVHTLIEADGALSGDLQSLSQVNALSASSWATQFSRDATIDGTDANLVRHDLGLPASTG
jgi:hypothetical protein